VQDAGAEAEWGISRVHKSEAGQGQQVRGEHEGQVSSVEKGQEKRK